MSQSELELFPADKCVRGNRREPFLLRRRKNHLQSIVLKLNSRRHFGLLPSVTQFDIPWSAKRPIAVFRGKLTGLHSGGYDKT